jgi:hypothetical protein
MRFSFLNRRMEQFRCRSGKRLATLEFARSPASLP